MVCRSFYACPAGRPSRRGSPRRPCAPLFQAGARLGRARASSKPASLMEQARGRLHDGPHPARAGVYADLDFEALRNLEPLLEGHTGAVLAAMDGDRDFDHSVPNAWLASSRHHPFWLFVLQTIIRTAGKGDMSRRARARPALPCPRALTDSAPPPSHWRHVVQRPLDTPCLAATICADPAWQGMAAGQGHGRARAGQHRRGPARRADWVEATTGPVMLHTAIKAFQRANGTGLTILDPGTIYAINWRQTYVLHQAGRRSATWSCATSSTSTLTRPRARRCSPTPTR